jgi:hypothetical protein
MPYLSDEEIVARGHRQNLDRWRADNAADRLMLAGFEAGRRSVFVDRINTTKQFVEQLRNGIAAREKCIAGTERKLIAAF